MLTSLFCDIKANGSRIFCNRQTFFKNSHCMSLLYVLDKFYQYKTEKILTVLSKFNLSLSMRLLKFVRLMSSFIHFEKDFVYFEATAVQTDVKFAGYSTKVFENWYHIFQNSICPKGTYLITPVCPWFVYQSGYNYLRECPLVFSNFGPQFILSAPV